MNAFTIEKGINMYDLISYYNNPYHGQKLLPRKYKYNNKQDFQKHYLLFSEYPTTIDEAIKGWNDNPPYYKKRIFDLSSKHDVENLIKIENELYHRKTVEANQKENSDKLEIERKILWLKNKLKDANKTESEHMKKLNKFREKYVIDYKQEL